MVPQTVWAAVSGTAYQMVILRKWGATMPNSFDGIPGDTYQSWPCPMKNCSGSVSESEVGVWTCDTCTFCASDQSA